MKRVLTTLVLLVTGAATFLSSNAYSQSWKVYGTADFSNPSTNAAMALTPGGTPYVAYRDSTNGNFASVKFYNAGSWIPAGSAAFSSGAASSISIAVSSAGTPYVAYSDASHSQKVTVMKYTAGTWTVVGTAGLSGGAATYTSIALDGSDNPYVAYQDATDSQRVTVKKYSGTSWSTVGTIGFSAGRADYVKLAISGTTPYVTYSDYSAGKRATVMQYNGSAWVTVGTAGFSAGRTRYNNMAISASGIPYVIYADTSAANKATVMTYTGASWVTVGSAGFSAGPAGFTSIAISAAGVPFVVYQDSSLGQKAVAKRFIGSVWSALGLTAGVSPGSAANTTVAVNGVGTPYMLFNDGADSGKTTVMVFNVSPITGTFNICRGSTTTLVDTTSGGKWKSTVPTVATIDSASGLVSAIAQGTTTISYSVNGFSASAIVHVFSLPGAGSITGMDSVCTNSTTALADSVPNGTWTSSAVGVASVSATGVVAGVTVGYTTISYAVSNVCGSATVNQLVKVNPQPVPYPLHGEKTVCVGATSLLYDAISGGTWTSSSPGKASVNASGFVRGVSAGTLTITYNIAEPLTTCHSISTYAMTVNPLPTPAFTISGDILTSTYVYPSYAWMRDSTILLGATFRSYNAIASGNYILTVTDTNGCTASTSASYLIASEVNNVSGSVTIGVYPNPVQNSLYIEYAGTADATVATMDGRLLFSLKETKSIDMNSMPNGIYLVSIYDHNTGNLLKTEKIIKKAN